jgi:hypothetical protein
MIDEEAASGLRILSGLLEEICQEVEFAQQIEGQLHFLTGETTALRASDSPYLGYKLHREGENSTRNLRVMFDQRTTDGSLRLRAKAQLRTALMRFFGPECDLRTDAVWIDY